MDKHDLAAWTALAGVVLMLLGFVWKGGALTQTLADLSKQEDKIEQRLNDIQNEMIRQRSSIMSLHHEEANRR